MDWLNKIRKQKNEVPPPFTLTYNYENRSVFLPDGMLDIPFTTNADTLKAQIALIDHLRAIASRMLAQMSIMYGDEIGNKIAKMTTPGTRMQEYNAIESSLNLDIERILADEDAAESRLDQMRLNAEIEEFEKGVF